AVPGLILLLVCRQTLEYTRVNDNFISRTEYPAGYAFAMWTLAAGVSLLAVWLLLLTMDTLDLTHFSFLPALLEVGVLVALSGVVLGGLLDYLALRKTHLT
ncbi:MFS transporter, partial [Escherichia coli]